MNPTGQPDPYAAAPPPQSSGTDELTAPSMFLLVVGVLSILLILMGLLFSMLGLGAETLNKLVDQADLPPALKNMQSSGSSAANVVINLFQLAINGLVVFGALQMKNRKNWGLAVAAAVIAMIPCFNSCCCLLGLPAGIWSLVILMKPEIKAQFT